MAESSRDFSGAEIEQAVLSALYECYDLERGSNHSGGKPVHCDLGELVLKAIDETVPLARAMQPEIAAIREWSASRARIASADSPLAAGEKYEPHQRARFAFLFRSGHRARSIEDLVALCEKFPDETREYLESGRLESWLRDNDYLRLFQFAVTARESTDHTFAVTELLNHMKAQGVHA